MIIDSHIHLLPRKVRNDRSPHCESDPAFGLLYTSQKARLASEDDILNYLDESGIDKAVVFGFPWGNHELVAENNDEIWDFHQRNPERIIPFAVLSSSGGDRILRETERTLRAGFAGIGELAMYRGGWSQDGFESLKYCLREVARAEVPVLIHVNEPVGHHYPGKMPVDMNGLLNMIEKNPDVDFILAHFGGGVFVYALMPEVGKILKRTYLDTAASPFLYDPKIFAVAAESMGADKILFGSDFPLLPLKRYLRDLDHVHLEADIRSGILGGNAEKLFFERGRETAPLAAMNPHQESGS
jgi:uncharacterized protein